MCSIMRQVRYDGPPVVLLLLDGLAFGSVSLVGHRPLERAFTHHVLLPSYCRPPAAAVHPCDRVVHAQHCKHSAHPTCLLCPLPSFMAPVSLRCPGRACFFRQRRQRCVTDQSDLESRNVTAVHLIVRETRLSKSCWTARSLTASSKQRVTAFCRLV